MLALTYKTRYKTLFDLFTMWRLQERPYKMLHVFTSKAHFDELRSLLKFTVIRGFIVRRTCCSVKKIRVPIVTEHLETRYEISPIYPKEETGLLSLNVPKINQSLNLPKTDRPAPRNRLSGRTARAPTQGSSAGASGAPSASRSSRGCRTLARRCATAVHRTREPRG